MSRSIALIGALAVAMLAACSRPEPAPEPVRAVRTMKVAPSRTGVSVEYAGEIRARTESRLGFRVGGKLVKRSVDLGQTVKAGQVLAVLDAEDLRLGQQAAQAAQRAAQANAEWASADLKRYRELRDQGFISTAEVDRRETAYKAAVAQLNQARAQADVQVNQTGYGTLKADADGVITGVDAEPGQVVAAGTPVVRLAHEGPRDVVFSVPEDHVERVRPSGGTPAVVKVRLWGSDAALLDATVREVAAAADPATRTFLVKADLGRAAVRLGQTATVVIDLPGRDGVTKLPLTALFEQGGRSAVWVLDEAAMTVSPRPVELGGADGNSVVVAQGLEAGQEVVVAGVHVLNPGQKVKRYVEPVAAPAR